MQRSSVDLPEPDAPISAIARVLGDGEVDAAQHRPVAVGLGDAADLEDRRSSAAPPLPAVEQPRERHGHAQVEQRRGDQRRVDEVRRRLDLRDAERLERPEDRDQRDVLLQRDEVVEQRRRDAPDRLRAARRGASPGPRSARPRARPRAGSGGPTRCPRGRPRRRRPSRRASARSRRAPPGRSAARRASAPGRRSRSGRRRGSSGRRGRRRRRSPTAAAAGTAPACARCARARRPGRARARRPRRPRTA